MTTTATTAVVADDDQRERPRRPWRRRALAVVLALLLAAVGGAAWWMSHPRAFQDVGDSMSGPTEPGKPIFLGMVHPPEGVTLDLVDAVPRVLFDNADAELTVHVCRLARPGNAIGIVYADDAQRICASLRAPSGPLEENDQLVVELVASMTGVVVVDGLDVTYRTGLQRGNQATGVASAVVIGEPGSTS